MTADRAPSIVENLVGLLVAVAVATQTWMLVQEATGGEAGRTLRRWWAGVGHPYLVRARTWLDAAAVTERMIADEVIPLLEEQQP